ncbi:MAG TPA: S9 family peptidase [Bryobacteraceae bacterium]|nr:S9 family peptidase [Bryobacteraceae bacterium]
MKYCSAVVLCFSIVCSAHAQNGARISAILTELNQTRTFSGVSISPDAHWATWTEKIPGQAATQTWLRDLSAGAAGGKLSPIAAPGHVSVTNHSVAWSPDGTRFAFLSEVGAGSQRQLFVMKPGDSEAIQVTHVTGYVKNIRWSPDGKQIAFLYAENGGGGGPLEALAAPVGDVGAEIHNQQITVIEPDGSGLRCVSVKNLNVYEYDWSPDGRRFAAIAAKGPADNNWWIAKLYAVDVASGAMKVIYAPPPTRQIAIPRWSPDNTQIAFIGGVMSDEGFIGGDIFVLNATGGDARNITPGMQASASSLRWTSPDALLFTRFIGGSGGMASVNAASGKIQTVIQDPTDLHDDGNFPNLAISSDAKTWVAARSDWQHPPEVWIHRGNSEWQALTNANSGLKAHWGKAESLTWQNDGLNVQGWLLYPEHFDPAKRYPMIVSIHGGPAGVHDNDWPSTHFDMSVMAALDYFVLFPNPRGSYGQGEAFTRGNIQDFGGGDLRDILAGVDDVLKRVPVDNDRLGVTGWSYGGYMTMWTVTQTQRFRAAVAGAGIANWLSYYGENSIDEWMVPYFGDTVYNNPAAYAKSSPIEFIKKVKTPTLILVGENDAECPSPQSFEFWHALNALDVPTHLIVYPGEGHSFNKDKDQIDRMQRTAAWFDQFLSAH